MKIYGATVLVVMVVIITTSFYFKSRAKPSQQPGREPARTVSPSFCLAQADVGGNIARLSGEDADANDAVKRLVSASGSSIQCRGEIIQNLIFAMKLNSDLRYQARFNLWFHGKDVLSALKAVEALDFLIDHLNQSDGQFSASMIHQPAFAAVTGMGDAAIPKLAEALKHHSDRDVRLTVALCLIEIGGDNATNALKEVAKTDSDECVRRFIELSLKESTKEIIAQRLVAYRCDN